MRKKCRTAISFILSLALLTGCSELPDKTGKADPKTLSGNNTQEAAALSSVSKNASGQHSIKSKNIPLYMEDAEHKEDIDLYYIDGSTVPYISADTVLYFLQSMQDTVSYELEYDGEHAIFTRKGSKFTCDFDFENDSITFFDFDAFLKGNAGPVVNVVIPDDGAEAALFDEVDLYSNDRYGKVMTFDLKPYEISLVHEGDGYYLPLQTISDLILTYNATFTLCNGEAVFYLPGKLDDELAEIYYSVSGNRTEEFAKFDYNELCFALDNIYGLKETHNISDFDTFFFECGIRNKLRGTDQTKADIALKSFIEYHLDDIHSSFNKRSYMSDEESFETAAAEIYGPWHARYTRIADEFYDTRAEFFPDGVPPYEEIGDTAYISFDKFTHPSEDIDYKSEPTEDELYDTIRLVQYSRNQILRPDSPIKNVVMDLSFNTGGDAISAAYVIAFYLGLGDLSIVNTMTGASGSAAYMIDTNRDGKFTADDHLSLKGLNLYCLISPVSFSSGNLVPNAYMMSPRVTLLGMTSGGGSCDVHLMSTAGGSMIQISGYKRISLFKNGSFYDIDRGATPDFGIAKMKNFYDRKALTEYIDNLF
ncbi:S41 family peptidase [Lachnospiraceae bacterium C1.1]|nr:S41 family peptidase [Lachnospiraceae bacterium C1.1]